MLRPRSAGSAMLLSLLVACLQHLVGALASSGGFSMKGGSLPTVIQQQSGIYNVPGIFVGGPTTSIEVYACQPETLDLTVGQIHNWIQVESYAIMNSFTHSAILASLDRRRVVHLTGWRLEPRQLFYAFEAFKKRADGKDGTPAALKESTHLYSPVGQFPGDPASSILFTSTDRSTYPLYSIDIFTSKRQDGQDALVKQLRRAMEGVASSLVVPQQLQSTHLLKSVDPLAAAVVSSWRWDRGADEVQAAHNSLRQDNQAYSDAIDAAKDLAITGTYTDVFEKTDPLKRLFFVCEVLLPPENVLL